MYRFAIAALVFFPVLAQAQTQQGQPQQSQPQQGQASYFDAGPNGHTKTASGAPVKPNANTAASRTLPLGSTAKVTNERNGKSTDVKITDRGPTRKDRVIDLSHKAAGDIGMQKTGTAPVTVQPQH